MVLHVSADESRLQLFLSRYADQAWVQVVRPWLEAGRGRLERTYVIVATRGQAQALKQRCLEENRPLLGVEFLTPGLARRKWVAAAPSADPPRTVIGRELLLLGLRVLLARRVAGLTPSEPEWGFWKSLQSDAEGALDDFDALIAAGFGPADFPLAPLQTLFAELLQWVEDRGYVLAGHEAQSAALAQVPAATAPLADRVLVYGVGTEWWHEFFNIVAFIRRCGRITAVLPAPEFGGNDADERWIELWRTVMGVDVQILDESEPGPTCEAVAALWNGDPADEAAGSEVLVGRTRRDEMRRVADHVVQLLQSGATGIGVVFPKADAAHLLLADLLAERRIPYVDLLETAGPPPVDGQVQRGVLRFHENGARLEDLLELWPWLRAIGAATLSLAEARRRCEWAFDDRQTHAVAAYLPEWTEKAPELARVVGVLLPRWPEQLTLADALQRFRTTCAQLEVEAPGGIGALDTLAERETAPLPREVVLAALESFLPERHPVTDKAGRAGFARVTFTTRRRAQGLAWSHLILVESNAGVWPERREPSVWLTDEQREELNRRGRFSLGLFTSETLGALERQGYRGLARDTRGGITFSAALFSEEEPELKLAPNAWLERVLWSQGAAGMKGDLERAFENLAESSPPPAPAEPVTLAAWHAAWRGRRDPSRPFDEYFFSGDPAQVTPARLSPRLIERGVQDPAELWFEAVLETRRVGWDGFVRARRKALGLRAHELLAAALRPLEISEGFGELPERDVARGQLDAALSRVRSRWPSDQYWDGFHAELSQLCRALLENVYLVEAGRFVATELRLPANAHLPLPHRDMPLRGRMDLVRLDRPQWEGAQVDIIDFKTGGDLQLDAKRMARRGASLQLGVYLAAALSLGARSGRVWMLKPEAGAMAGIDSSELPEALAPLQWLDEALRRGVFGALTRDRSDYAPDGCAYPLACTPVPALVLREKFALSFGVEATEGGTDE